MPVPSTAAAREALLDLLDFYAEAGVDGALSETGFDRFAAHRAEGNEKAEPARESRRAAPRTAARPEPPQGEAPGAGTRGSAANAPPADSPEAVMAARELASKARSLDELRAILDAFEGVSLKHTAKRLVFADGNPQAEIMLVGEKPGAEEDQEGRPFCGRSGALLDRMLRAIGLDRTTIYLANIVPWRPPANRTPTPQEVEILRPFVERQIALVAPRLLVALGGPATSMLLRSKDGILKTRGKWQDFAGETGPIPVLPMLHPAYLLRQPLQKRVAWHDLLVLKDALDAG